MDKYYKINNLKNGEKRDPTYEDWLNGNVKFNWNEYREDYTVYYQRNFYDMEERFFFNSNDFAKIKKKSDELILAVVEKKLSLEKEDYYSSIDKVPDIIDYIKLKLGFIEKIVSYTSNYNLDHDELDQIESEYYFLGNIDLSKFLPEVRIHFKDMVKGEIDYWSRGCCYFIYGMSKDDAFTDYFSHYYASETDPFFDTDKDQENLNLPPLGYPLDPCLYPNLWSEFFRDRFNKTREEYLDYVRALPVIKAITLYKFREFLNEKLEEYEEKKLQLKNFKGFECSLSKKQVNVLFEKLKSNFIHKNTDLNNFIAVFSNNILPYSFRPIVWIKGKNSLRELLTLISGYNNKTGNKYIPNNVATKIIPELFEDDFGHNIILNKPKKNDNSQFIVEIEQIIKAL